MSLEDFTNRVLPVKNKLFRFAMRLVGNSDDAEDIVQDVFVKVWDRRGEMHTYQNMEAWCMRLVKNLFLDQVKSKRNQTTDRFPENDWSATVTGSDQTPYQVTEINDTMQQVHQLIERLPPKQKLIIQLRDIEGYSYQEIGEIMGMDVSGVKVTLFRARAALRKGLSNAENYGLDENQ